MAKFTGADGSVWNFRFEIPHLVEFLDMLDLYLGDMIEGELGILEKIKLLKMSQLIDAVWLLAEETAEKRKISKKQFFTEIVKPNIMNDVIAAFYEALSEAFDTGEVEEKGKKGKKAPLESGTEKT